MKGMVVEDEPVSSKPVCVVLAGKGHNVRTASTAEAALESVKPQMTSVSGPGAIDSPPSH